MHISDVLLVFFAASTAYLVLMPRRRRLRALKNQTAHE